MVRIFRTTELRAMKQTTLTISNEHGEYSVTIRQTDTIRQTEMTLDDVMEMVYSVLCAAGYSSSMVEEKLNR